MKLGKDISDRRSSGDDLTNLRSLEDFKAEEDEVMAKVKSLRKEVEAKQTKENATGREINSLEAELNR